MVIVGKENLNGTEYKKKLWLGFMQLMSFNFWFIFWFFTFTILLVFLVDKLIDQMTNK